MKSEEYILAANDPDSGEDRPENFLPNEYKKQQGHPRNRPANSQ